MDPSINIEDFLNECKNKFQEDTQFLVDQGWTQTDEKELNDEKVFSVWVSPEGKKYYHQSHLFGSTNLTSAIDKAESDYIRKCGFKDFTLFEYCPEIVEELNNGWEAYAMYVHPNGRVYTYVEAVEIARFNNMKDLDSELCCPKTNQIQKIITDNNIIPTENTRLYVDFVLEDKEIHFYKFNKVEEWN